jgi:hypothetical protein
MAEENQNDDGDDEQFPMADTKHSITLAREVG